MKELLVQVATSDVAIVFYSSLVLFTWNWVKRNQGWDTERWEGLIAAAFNAAEKSDLKTSNAKLNLALEVFSEQFQETYDKEPDATDLKDAALDLARYAYELKKAQK